MADLYRYGETKPIYFRIVDTSGNKVTGHTFSTTQVYASIDGGTFSDISTECSEVGRGWYKWTPSSAAQTQGEVVLFDFDDGTNADNGWQIQTGGDPAGFHDAT